MHAVDLLTSRVHLTPNREALLYSHSGERFTYAQLNARAHRTANGMRERFGVQKGDRVSILANNSVIYLDLFYGLAKIGAIFAPLNWRLMARELSYIVQDCAPKVGLCGPEFTQTLNELRKNRSSKSSKKNARAFSACRQFSNCGTTRRSFSKPISGTCDSGSTAARQFPSR